MADKIKTSFSLDPIVDKALELAAVRASMGKGELIESLIRDEFPREMRDARKIIQEQGE